MTWIAADLTEPDAPGRILARAQGTTAGQPAGQQRRCRLARDLCRGGYENDAPDRGINFDAVLRLTETFLPMLREAPQLDRQHRLDHGPRFTTGLGCLLGLQVRPDRLERRTPFGRAPHGVHVGLVCQLHQDGRLPDR